MGYHVSEERLKEIMALIDENGNGNLICFLFIFVLNFFLLNLYEGEIDYKEFKDMLDKTKVVSDPDADLRDAFKVFDIDGDGIITARELKLIMNTLGQSVSEADIDEMIKEADTDCKFIYYLFSFFQHLISLYLQF